jgi:peptide/nickel transport system substrate-binding protein
MSDDNYWTRSFPPLSRRRFLRYAGASAAAAAAFGLAACGGSSGAGKNNGGTSSSAGTTGVLGTAAAAASSRPPSGSATPVPKAGGTLTSVLSVSPGFLDAHASTGGQDVTFLRALYDNIVKRGDDMVPRQDWSIAQSWDILQDGKQIDFHIRPGVTFHDGTPLDAEAVKWNFDNFLSPDNNSPERANVAAIQSVDVVDATTVRMSLSRVSSSILNLLGDRAGMLLSPTAYQSEGKDAFRRNPVASGPFKFKEWVQDDHITFVRNENYWRKPLPYLDTLRWNFIQDPTVQLANVQSGKAQLAGVTPANLATVKSDPNLKVMSFTGGSVVNFYINTTLAPWDNKYNRLAFAWAIDRQAIVKGLLLGNGVPAVGPISPAHQWAYTPNVPNAPGKDNAMAKDFLSKAGNPKGYSIHLIGGNDSTSVQEAEAIKAQVAEVGIDMSYEPLDVTTYVQRAIVDKSVPGYFSGIVLRGDPNQLSQVFASDGYYNPGHQKDDVGNQIDSLLMQADSTFDLNQRKAIYLQLTKVINDDARGIFLWYSVANDVLAKNLQGWSFGSEGNGRWEEAWFSS